MLGLLLLTLLAREVQETYSEMSLENIHEQLAQVEVAAIQPSYSTKVIKTLVEMPEDARKLIKLLQLASNV